MTLSRKDFFRHGFFSLGETILKVSGTVRELQDSLGSLPVDVEPDREPVPDKSKAAKADNQLCLAKTCGCFSCVDRCEAGAIKLIRGVGIRINQQLCSGCGTCEYVCPVTPKAIRMQARTEIPTPSADQAEQPPQKGE